jgi:hypothetical protein
VSGALAGPLAWQPTTQTQRAGAQLLLAATRVEELGLPGVASVAGGYGLGKTTLVDRHVRDHYLDARRPVLRLQLQAAPKPNEMTILLLRQLGVRSTSPGYLLREELTDQLRDVRSLIVIDEAHHMTRDPLRGLKQLVDALPLTDWILIGTDELPAQLGQVPELRDRVSFPVTIAPLTLGEVLRVLPSAHPLLGTATQELIARVDADFAHGRWRSWRDFAGHAVQLATRANTTTLTDKLASAAIAAAGGPRPDPTSPKSRTRKPKR